ncbi:MAG TPA: hypothetical protein PK668_11800 [Myxococcota bacterium]|nr:hypothetical protein [Myxococcota bacterium]HRY93848.1 hypothetical protein [Myxococcota bacterium]
MADNEVNLDVTLGIIERGSVALSFNPGKFFSLRNSQGEIQSALWPGMPLAAAPLVALGSMAEHLLSQGEPAPLTAHFQTAFSDNPEFHIGPEFEPNGLRDQERIDQLKGLSDSERRRLLHQDARVQAFTLVAPLASAATVMVFFLSCLALGLGLRIALWSSAALGIASPVFYFAGTCWTQPLATLAVAAAIHQVIHLRLALDRRRVVVCGTFASLSALVRPDLAPIALVIGVTLLCIAMQRTTLRATLGMLAWFCLPLAISAGVLLLWNWLRFASWLVIPGANQLMLFLARHLPEGLPGPLFSPGAGLLWFFPFLALSVVGFRNLKADHRWLLWLVLALVGVVLLVYGAWWQWWSEWSYGPRYHLPLVSVLALAAAYGLARAGRRLWTAAKILVGLGLLVQVPGVLLLPFKLPSPIDPSVWWSFPGFTSWGSLWASVIAREPLNGYAPGIDCLSADSWFYRLAAVLALGAGALLLRRRGPRLSA